MGRLFEREDAASLVVWRVLFGLLMAVDIGRYLVAGWVTAYYVDPPFTFKYLGFGWVEPLPGWGMYAVAVAALVAALALAAGAAARLSAIVVFAVTTYLFALAATHYLNHAYLLCLLALLMVMVPHGRSPDVARWPRLLLRFQVGVVFVFGGIAKINADWVAGVPAGPWLAESARHVPLFGRALASAWVVPIIVWGGMLYDLAIVPALLWRRTRAFAVVVSVMFHLTNAYIFYIGIFPWMMIASLTLFLEPDWPRRVPRLGKLIDRYLGTPDLPRRDPSSRRIVVALAVWATIQVAVPLRHWLYPGDVAWTEEGHYFSWRMKLRSKIGQVTFRVRDPATAQEWAVDPEDELTVRQARKMSGKPDLIVQYAHHLGRRFSRFLERPVEVRVDARVRLNYRPPALLIDRELDLMTVQPSLAPSPWILPAPQTPLPRPRRG